MAMSGAKIAFSRRSMSVMDFKASLIRSPKTTRR